MRVTLSIVSVALALAGIAAAETPSKVSNLKVAALNVAEGRRDTWACQDKLIRVGVLKHRTQASVSVWALPSSLAYRTKYVLPLWEKRAQGCERLLQAHTLPNTNDWATAVRIAQRPYPGTAGRADFISDREGGSGPWVWWGGSCSHRPCLWRGYHIGYDKTGDTVGGWVQFRYSTFIVYWPGVVADLKRRGYIIPDLGWARPRVVVGASTGYGPWLSPLGQALTFAYMHYYGKQGCHWCL